MNKDINDYIHLYLGCKMFFDNKIWELTEVNIRTCQLRRVGQFNRYVEIYPSQGKLILRKLSDMTEEDEEATGLNATYEYGHHTFTPQEFVYFLSKGFDLFGLIDAGLAIDKTTLNKQS